MQPLLEPDILAAQLQDLPAWRVEDGCLVTDLRFSSYMAGVHFACAVAEMAEQMNHHPDIHIGWRRVRLSIQTHSAGGITELDTQFAARVDELPERQPVPPGE
jgi:4a-hydroxytetrahydrobiopterin dehydratase